MNEFETELANRVISTSEAISKYSKFTAIDPFNNLTILTLNGKIDGINEDVQFQPRTYLMDLDFQKMTSCELFTLTS